MASSIAASGETTPSTLGVEQTLSTVTAPTGGASYVAQVDVSALAADEVVEITFLSRARVGDALALKDRVTAGSTSIQKLIECEPIVCNAGNDVRLNIRQENGTLRAFRWAIKRVDG